MSATLHSRNSTGNRVTIDRTPDGTGVALGSRGQWTTIGLDRAEFLAAVEAALGVKFMELPSLTSPPVLEHGGQVKSGSVTLPRGASPEYAESVGRHYFALAAWMREHPPVDEAQVEAVTRALESAEQAAGSTRPSDIARLLVERGVRVEVASD